MKRAFLTVAVVCLISGGLSAGPLGDYFESIASALPNKFKIQASQEVGFTDNADENHERRSSIFSRTELQMDVLRELDNGLAYGMTGGIGYEWYDRRERWKDSEFSWNLGPKFLGQLNVFGNDKLMIRLRSMSGYDRDNSDTERIRTEEIGGDIIYDYSTGGHFGFALIGTYDYTHYPEDEYSNRTNSEYQFSFAPYYKLTELTKVGLRLAYGETLYNSTKWQDDSETLTLNAFVDYQLTGYVSMHGELGMQRTEYDGTHGNRDNSEWSPDASFSIKYYPVSNVAFRFRTAYETEDTGSSNRGGRDSWTQTLGMDWALTEKTTLTQELSYDLKDEKNGESSDNGELNYKICANFKFTERVVFYAGYEVNDVRYDYQDRRDYRANEWVLGVRCSL